MPPRFRFSRPSHGTIVAYLALFVALGGTAFAVTNFVGTNGQIHGCVRKKGTLVLIKPGAKCKKGSPIAWNQKGPRGNRGPRGLQGQDGAPGQNATKLFAAVSNGSTGTDANLQYGNGVTAVSRTSMGNYKVTFDHSVANCVVFAEPEFGDPLAGSASIPQLPSTSVVMNSAGHHDQVEVHVDQPTGTSGQPNTAHVDSSFVIAAFC